MTRAELLALAARAERSPWTWALIEDIAKAAGWRVKVADGLRYWRRGDNSWTAEMEGVPPNFLEDLNAAASLVPESSQWEIAFTYGEASAAVWRAMRWRGRVYAATPALALTAAALRAMAEEARDE
jgi:hypothetical protein